MSTPSDDDFDNDALQEGLGRSLGGMPPMPQLQPGLAQALLAPSVNAPAPQECLDIYRYPGIGLNPFGHIGFSKEGGPVYGKTAIPGGDISSLTKAVPGELEQVSADRRPDDQIQICGNPAQMDPTYQYWIDPKHSQSYYARGGNCATLIADGLRSANLPAPSGPGCIFPGYLMWGLHKLYDAPHHLVDTRPQLPKY